MPSVATPSTQSNSVQAGLGNLGAGIARAMDNRYQAQKDAQAQANWEKSFAQQKALQDFQMRQLQSQMDRQKEQREGSMKLPSSIQIFHAVVLGQTG